MVSTRAASARAQQSANSPSASATAVTATPAPPLPPATKRGTKKPARKVKEVSKAKKQKTTKETPPSADLPEKISNSGRVNARKGCRKGKQSGKSSGKCRPNETSPTTPDVTTTKTTSQRQRQAPIQVRMDRDSSPLSDILARYAYKKAKPIQTTQIREGLSGDEAGEPDGAHTPLSRTNEDAPPAGEAPHDNAPNEGQPPLLRDASPAAIPPVVDAAANEQALLLRDSSPADLHPQTAAPANDTTTTGTRSKRVPKKPKSTWRKEEKLSDMVTMPPRPGREPRPDPKSPTRLKGPVYKIPNFLNTGFGPTPAHKRGCGGLSKAEIEEDMERFKASEIRQDNRIKRDEERGFVDPDETADEDPPPKKYWAKTRLEKMEGGADKAKKKGKERATTTVKRGRSSKTEASEKSNKGTKRKADVANEGSKDDTNRRGKRVRKPKQVVDEGEDQPWEGFSGDEVLEGSTIYKRGTFAFSGNPKARTRNPRNRKRKAENPEKEVDESGNDNQEPPKKRKRIFKDTTIPVSNSRADWGSPERRRRLRSFSFPSP